MARQFYSQQTVRSALTGKTYVFPSTDYEVLISWADTTPGVIDYEPMQPSLTYQQGAKTKETTVPLTLHMQDGSTHFWDFHRGKASQANDVRKLYAQNSGGVYRCFDAEANEMHFAERQNRRHLRCLMVHGRGFDTSCLEGAALRVLSEQGTSVPRLAAALDCTAGQALLAVARLWLRQFVHLPLAERMTPESWLIQRSASWT